MALVKKLTKIGNSLGIILPTEILRVAGMDTDSEVEISVKDNEVLLRPTKLKDHKVMKTFMGVVKDYDQTLRKLAK
ncbi:MAG: AbrB/MazE/SpoVT family DNA-binding domain-containing protein [Deltaproteobacteria bacterium]|nr:AbrB/MazE/SpoVT family DNA-binding domain-containing protein [Deltaproteobacteria bacterium]